MTHQDTIICEQCEQPYFLEELECPACGYPNPLYLEETADEIYYDEEELESQPERKAWWRKPMGCISLIIFLSLITGGIILGAYEGLKERTIARQLEVNTSYEQALNHYNDGDIELAIAALSKTLSLNPAHTEARDLLRELKNTQEQIPTPTSETRHNVAGEMYSEVEALALQGDWEGVKTLLSQIRDIDPGFQPELVSEHLYTANYELGLRLMAEDDLPEALKAFDEALVEKPNDPLVTAEWEKISLYLSVQNEDSGPTEDTIIILERLYNLDPTFADVKEQLHTSYKSLADSLVADDEWCLAYPRYESALELIADEELETQLADAEFRCEASLQPTPTATRRAVASLQATGTPTSTASISNTTALTPTASTGQGNIYFSRLNSSTTLWEVIAYNLSSGEETVIQTNATQPAVNGNNLLVYHSELADSIGLHSLKLNTGEGVRVTIFNEDILPRWGRSNEQFVFASQRAGDRRWQIFTAFADGKSDAIVIHDGRTPALSYQGNIVAFQGTDAQGNNPGLYTIPLGGGEITRITEHESDRSPAFSPPNNQIAYMTTENGNWDIYTVAATGGTPKPLVTSPANDGLPIWSPDGSQVAFVSDRGGSWGIYVVASSGGNATKIANWGNHPDWLLAQLSWGR